MDTESKKRLVPEHIENLNAYKPGKTTGEAEQVYNPARIAKLASNENRLGFSPAVKAAVMSALGTANNYPDPAAKKLKSAVAEKLGVPENRVVIGAGSDSIISMICRTFFNPGEHIVTSSVTFMGVYVQAGVFGIPVNKIPLTADYRFDVQAIAAAITAETKLIYIANPNNPTGTCITKKEFEWLMERVPADVLVVMDEAYSEFAEGTADFISALEYDFENVIVLRTFSKAYGLAGFRIGYAVASEKLTGYLSKTKLIFEPSAPAQAAALAAIRDTAFLAESIRVVKAARERVYHLFDEFGIRYVPSVSNSVLMLTKGEAEAAGFTRNMLERGVILRHVHAFGMPEGVRISMGTNEDMDQFEAAFREIMHESRTG